MISSVELFNESIYLQPIHSKKYSRKITNWLNDPSINMFLMARYKRNTETEQVRYIEQVNASSSAYYFGIFLLHNSRLIGTTTCRIKEGKFLEVGILIGEKKFPAIFSSRALKNA